ncbi:PA-phosphatase [Mycobacterium sp. SWH-M3]|nr:PA-phosphatase [Mycobacterium sp. SWH-M3]
MMRWWPPIGLAAMMLLGGVVGDGSTAVDDWFQRLGARMGQHRGDFLVFSYPPLVALVLLGVLVAVARRRQWWLLVAVAASPPLAIVVVQVCKRMFGREKGGSLAYPSGHTTFLVVVMGLLVVAAGAAAWSLIAAVSVSLLGMFGQSVTYHYFTDTVGATLLATAMVCVVALVARDVAGSVSETSLSADSASTNVDSETNQT